MAPARKTESALVVEDHAATRRALMEALRGRFARVDGCASVRAAVKRIRAAPPDLLVSDFALPDGDAEALLDAIAGCAPAPAVVIISGAAEPEQAFALAAGGARAYVSKPVTLERLEAAVALALETPAPLAAHARQSVGKLPLRDATEGVRDAMVGEALARTRGSRRGAARLLGTSRQLLQYLLKRS